jgi:mono/diheme cytochrome c family protein
MNGPRRVLLVLALADLAGLATGCSRGTSQAPEPAVTRTSTATKAAPAPALTVPAVPAAPAPYPVSIGRQVYRHYCMTCHGESGAGDGFNAFNLDPHPRDFSDPAFVKKSDAEVRDAIRRGGAGVGLSPLMPPWGRTLNDRQIDDLILYLKTLRRPPSG